MNKLQDNVECVGLCRDINRSIATVKIAEFDLGYSIKLRSGQTEASRMLTLSVQRDHVEGNILAFACVARGSEVSEPLQLEQRAAFTGAVASQ